MKLVTFLMSDDDAEKVWQSWTGNDGRKPAPMVICNDLAPYKEEITGRLTVDNIKDF